MANDKDSKDQGTEDVPHVRKEPRPDFSKQPLPHVKLPEDLQSRLDSDEKFWDTLTEGKAKDSTETSTRYAAYASRVRTILVSAHRYVAYTSDIGESFRPIAHPFLIRGAYAVSWLYLTGDVAHEGYKAYLRNQAARRTFDPSLAQHDGHAQIAAKAQDAHESKDPKAKAAAVSQVAAAATRDIVSPMPAVPVLEDYRTVMVQRAVFQSIASMGLPAFTIHSIVRYSGRALKNSANKTLRTWAPIGLGLAAVPALPFMFDEPVEKGVEWVFHKGAQALGKDTPHSIEGGESKKEL